MTQTRTPIQWLRRTPTKGTLAVLVLAFTLSACSMVRHFANTYPRLSTVSARSQTASAVERNRIVVEGLVPDHENARYIDQAVRGSDPYGRGETTEGGPRNVVVGFSTPMDGVGASVSTRPADLSLPEIGFSEADYETSSKETGLLKRWPQSDVTAGAESDLALTFANSPNSSFSIVSDSNAETPGGAFSEDGEWQQEVTLSGEVIRPGGTRLAFGHYYGGERVREDETIGPLAIGQSEYWEEDKVNNTALEVGLLGDRLRLTTLQSLSRHMDTDLEDEVTGQGFFQGLDADILKGDRFNLSVSGSFGVADDAYRSVKGGGDDDFAGIPDPGAEATEYGLQAGFALPFADLSLSHDKSWVTGEYSRLVSSDYKVGLGFDSLNLTLSYYRSLETVGHGEGRERPRYSAEVGYEVGALRHILGGAFGDAFWDFAPDFISVKYGIEQGKTSGGERDETTDLDVTASWDWDGGYASLDYSYSFSDGQRFGSEDDDYRTQGIDIGGGLYGTRWSFDGGLNVSRSESLGRWSESTELGIDSYLTFSYQPDNWPDVSLSGSTSHYQADYISDNGTSISGYWEALVELDFAKFSPDVLGSEDEDLKAVFGIQGDTSIEKWDGEASNDSALDYYFGLKLEITLGR